jgi:hypothetical protein
MKRTSVPQRHGTKLLVRLVLLASLPAPPTGSSAPCYARALRPGTAPARPLPHDFGLEVSSSDLPARTHGDTVSETMTCALRT